MMNIKLIGRVLLSVLVAAMFSFVGVGCQSDGGHADHDHPKGEHPKGEHADHPDHPKTD